MRCARSIIAGMRIAQAPRDALATPALCARVALCACALRAMRCALRAMRCALRAPPPKKECKTKLFFGSLFKRFLLFGPNWKTSPPLHVSRRFESHKETKTQKKNHNQKKKKKKKKKNFPRSWAFTSQCLFFFGFLFFVNGKKNPE